MGFGSSGEVGLKALVTGGSGFIGSHVVAALARGGADVRALDRNPRRCPDWPDTVELLDGDVLDPNSVRGALEGCDAVFHLAAVYSYTRADAAAMRAVNVEGTRVVLEAAVRGPRRRIIHTSSCATCGPVRGRPATERDHPRGGSLDVPYRRTKIEGERLALDAARDGADVVVVNPTVPVGRGDLRPTPTGKMVADVARGRARAYLVGSALNVVGVEDVAAGHLAAYERGRRGERYLLGGENMTIREAFAVIARAVGREPPRVPVPWTVALAAALGAAAALRPLGREPRLLVFDEVRAGRLPHLFDDHKARTEIGYRSSPVAEALTRAARGALER